MASQEEGAPGPEAGDAAGESPPASTSSGSPRRRRRARLDEPRPHTATVRFSDQEQALLESTSRRAGLSIGAYLATVTLAHARNTVAEAPSPETGAVAGPGADAGRRGAEFLREFAQARDTVTAAWRQLRTVGGLLNQVATVGNSTGELPPNTAGVVDQVARATARVDTTVGELRVLTRARAALVR